MKLSIFYCQWKIYVSYSINNFILNYNFKTSQIKKCLKLCKNRYQTEYSGNASLKNIKQISRTGINRISVGAITHSAKSFDTTLLFR